ncbi:MAG: thioredoxin family protein [Coriobacteriales bacterium]
MGKVEVMGTGCKKCHQLYENACEALGAGSVEYVTDMARIAQAGVMSLPALLVDGRVVSSGKVLKPVDIATLAG